MLIIWEVKLRLLMTLFFHKVFICSCCFFSFFVIKNLTEECKDNINATKVWNRSDRRRYFSSRDLMLFERTTNRDTQKCVKKNEKAIEIRKGRERITIINRPSACVPACMSSNARDVNIRACSWSCSTKLLASLVWIFMSLLLSLDCFHSHHLTKYCGYVFAYMVYICMWHMIWIAHTVAACNCSSHKKHSWMTRSNQ